MSTDAGRGTVPERQRRGGHPFAGAAAVRSLVLGVAVFTLATLTGAMLSTTPEGPGAITEVEPLAAVVSPDAGGTPATIDPHDPLFAHSMIYTGVGALAISIAGVVMVARRRRHW